MKRIPRGVVLLATLLAGGCSSSPSPPADAGAPAEASIEASIEAATEASTDAGTSVDADAGTQAADTWDSWAQGFFATYCVECHTASDPTGRDYTLKADVVRDKLEIRCGVSATQDPSWMCAAFPPAKQFPIDNASKTNPKPTDAERTRAVAWITAGCP